MEPGDRIEAYELIEPLGRGGQAEVWRAKLVDTEQEWALKVVHGDGEYLPLLDEYNKLAEFTHPHIVRVRSFTRIGRRALVVMELMRGGKLVPAQVLESPDPLGRALAIGAGIASGLAVLHGRGIVHRDIKPDNILLSEDRVPKVSDIGIGSWAGRLDPSKTVAPKGTPLYMAPGQWEVETPVPAWDIFPLGLILCQLFGCDPFVVCRRRVVDPRWGPVPVPGLVGLEPHLDPGSAFLEPLHRVHGLADLVRGMLAPADEDRPTAEQVRDRLLEAARAHRAPEPLLRDVRTLPSIALDDVHFGDTLPVDGSDEPPERGDTEPLVRPDPDRRRGDDPPPLRPKRRWLRVVVPSVLGLGLLAAALAWVLTRPFGADLRADSVPIPAGSAVLGTDGGAYSDERPRRMVHLSAFRLARTEVRVRDFARFCRRRPDACAGLPGASLDPARAELPVTGVTWTEASAFCRATGGRLPKEAWFERAARGSSGRTWPWGEEPPDCRRAVVEGCQGPQVAGTGQVGATPEGILHLAGNVAEWTSDAYSPVWGRPEAAVTSLPGLRAVRGGSWRSPALDVRGAARAWAPEGARREDLGFRCAWAAGEGGEL